MRKANVLELVLGMVAVLVVALIGVGTYALPCTPSWKSISQIDVRGGACYQLTDWKLCGGGEVGCGGQRCAQGEEHCPVSTRKVNQGTVGYYASRSSIESGGTTDTKDTKVLCYLEEKCDTDCIATTGDWDYCGTGTQADKRDEKDRKEPGKTGC